MDSSRATAPALDAIEGQFEPTGFGVPMAAAEQQAHARRRRGQAQFFGQLARQRGGAGFAGLALAAGKFPLARLPSARRTAAQQQAPAAKE